MRNVLKKGWAGRSSKCIALTASIFFCSNLKAESSLYDFLWLDPDKKVYVLQNKVYTKKNRTYLNVGYISGQSSSYYDTNGVHLLIGHYLTEEWSLEFFYNNYKNKTNDNYNNLVEVNSVVPFSRQINESIGLMALWSPFYGKVNTFNKIFYFDWSIGAGIGKVKGESNANSVTDPNTGNIFEEESHTAGILKTGLRFHATENIHIGIDYKRTQYKANGIRYEDRPQEKSWRGHSDLVFSIGFSF